MNREAEMGPGGSPPGSGGGDGWWGDERAEMNFGPLGSVWRTSLRTSGTGQCVEARCAGGRVDVRDTKARYNGSISVNSETWTAFVTWVSTQGASESSHS